MSRPAVLMYHGFGRRSAAADPHNLFVTEDALDWQLPAIAADRALDLDGWLASSARRGGGVLVTIDDGYESTLDIAAPRLARAGVPGVLFVPPGLLGRTSSWMPEMPHERLLAPDRLRELADYGIEVGAHGFDHTDMVGMTPAELDRHTTEAATALADLTGARPRAFAYPRGVHDEAARVAVRQAGYVVAFAVYEGARDRWAVLRADINALDTPRSFALKKRPWYPGAKGLADRAPAVRRGLHRVIGMARR